MNLRQITTPTLQSDFRNKLIITLLAFLLSMSALTKGLQSDDYIHRGMLLDTNTNVAEKLNGFFEFLGPTENIPWWVEPDLKIKFWRPVSALTHWLDYELWPNHPLLMHLHSALWYVLLCFACLFFYRKLFSPPIAALAAIIFCLDFSHYANLSWIANRNSLISASLLVLATAFYIEWRAHGKILHYTLSILTFGISLFTGESAIGFLAIIFAFEISRKHLTESPEENKLNLPAVSIFFVLGLLWLGYYQSQGYGTANNSMYFKPGEDFLFSLYLIASKIPVILFGNFFGIEGFYNVFPDQIKLAISISCASVLLFALYIVRKGFLDRDFVFLFSSAVLLCIPVSFVAVVDMRLGLFPSIFSAAIIARLVFWIMETPLAGKIGNALIAFIILFHFIIPLTQWIEAGKRNISEPQVSFSSLKKLDKKYPQGNIFVLNYPSPIDFYYFPFTLNEKQNSRLYVLSPNFSNYQLRLTDKNIININSESGLIFKNNDLETLELGEKPLMHGVYARTAFNGMISPKHKFQKGQLFSHSLFDVEVLSVNEWSMAEEIQFRIHETENESLIVLWDSEKKAFRKLVANTDTDNKLEIKNW